MNGRMPDFLIIGAPKAGTTSLYHYLQQHPQIYMSSNKEPHFFAFKGAMPVFEGPGDDNAWLSTQSVVTLEAYQSLFSKASAAQVCGEASTMYLYLSKSCDRIHHYLPNARIILVLRHPVDRAYSHYKHLRRDGREWEKSFSQALALETSRIDQGWAPAWHYLRVGQYATQIEQYIEKFGAEQIRVYLYDDLVRSPQALYTDLFRFIGVDPNFSPDTAKRHNQTEAVRKNKLIHDFLTKPSGMKSLLKQVIPASIRKPLSAKVYRKNSSAIAPLSQSYRVELTRRLAPEILKLQDLIDRDLSGWLAP